MPGPTATAGWLVCRIRRRRIEPPLQRRAAPGRFVSAFKTPLKSPLVQAGTLRKLRFGGLMTRNTVTQFNPNVSERK